jgi:hypothetical protein
MDQEVLVNQLRKLARTVEKKAGPIALFMLLAPDIETEDAWNLMVSARGLDEQSRATAIKQLTEWLRHDVDESHWPRFSRVTVLRTDDPFVKAVNKAFRARRSVVNLQSVNLFGVEIPKAILLQSSKVAA